MAAIFEASTPPPPSRAIKNRTPSPRHSTARNTTSRSTSTVFGTPAASPKKRAPAMDSVRRAAAHLTAESSSDAAGLLGIPGSKSHAASATRGSGMLPTPAKTPSDNKKRNVEIEAGVRAAARTLFHDEVDTITSSRKKRSKKYTGVGLESFNAEEIDEPIEIFTDSRDRLPQVDRSLDNPFYGEAPAAAVAEPPKRRSPRRKMVVIPGEGRVPMEDAVQRSDGTVYVFRGKAFWKPNGDNSPADQDGEAPDDLLNGEEVGSPSRRLTRSSVQPRLLFPSKAKGKEIIEHNTEDEEAATDIEDHVVVEKQDGKDAIETPAEKSMPGTPTAPRFAPASPPSTTRTTRMSKRLEDSVTPMKRPTKTQSPFDAWRRSKSHAGPQGQKREADSPATGVAKRQRA
ncbi:hypothetical protein PG985_002602 [Apiospora marii]|uniref:uncharacterized protein n=1 Tax=Apiospora marii TaxID=335849 RepID=UPI0031327EB2